MNSWRKHEPHPRTINHSQGLSACCRLRSLSYVIAYIERIQCELCRLTMRRRTSHGRLHFGFAVVMFTVAISASGPDHVILEKSALEYGSPINDHLVYSWRALPPLRARDFPRSCASCLRREAVSFPASSLLPLLVSDHHTRNRGQASIRAPVAVAVGAPISRGPRPGCLFGLRFASHVHSKPFQPGDRGDYIFLLTDRPSSKIPHRGYAPGLVTTISAHAAPLKACANSHGWQLLQSQVMLLHGI